MRYERWKSLNGRRRRFTGHGDLQIVQRIDKRERFPRASEKFALDGHRDYDKLSEITEEQVPTAIAKYYTFVAKEMATLDQSNTFLVV